MGENGKGDSGGEGGVAGILSERIHNVIECVGWSREALEMFMYATTTAVFAAVVKHVDAGE